MRKIVLTLLALVSFSAPSFGMDIPLLIETLNRQQQVLCPRQSDPLTCRTDFATTKDLVSSFRGTAFNIWARHSRNQITTTQANEALKGYYDTINVRLSNLEKYK